MTTIIPKPLAEPPKTERRFYVVADSEIHLALQREAHRRGTDLFKLGGAVLTQWFQLGCPTDFSDAYEVCLSRCTGAPDCPLSPSPSSSPSREHKGGAA